MHTIADTVQDEICSTKRLLDEIELRQGDSFFHTKLIKFLRLLCDQATELIKVSSELLKSPDIKPEVTGIAKRFIPISCDVIRQVNSYCECFDYSDPLATSGVMNQFLGKLLRPITAKRAFILREMSACNYMYNLIGSSLNDLASKMGGTIPPLEPAFAVLSFPQAYKKDILNNTNLVHELGHFIVDSEGLAVKLNTELDKGKQDKVNTIIEKAARYSSGGEQVDLIVFTQRKEAAKAILANWIHEMMADAIGIHMIGAAHLFAFMSYEEPLGDYQSDDDEHPCDSTRGKLMVEILTKQGWDKVIMLECPEKWGRLLEICSLKRTPNEKYDGPDECLPIIWADVMKKVSDFLGTRGYKPDSFLADKDTMYDLLKRGIPPAEAIKTVGSNEIRSFDALNIINAGWFFKENGYPSWEKRFPDLNMNEKALLLNRLLTKAIEISFVAEVKI